MPENKNEPVEMFPISVTAVAAPKAGKTHFALTFPEPIVLFSFDIGYEPVLKKFKGKNVKVIVYPMPIIDSVRGKAQQSEVKEIWDKFSKDYKDACADPKVQTLIIDTGTHLYELARIARSRELQQENLMPRDYGDVYARLRAFIQRARLSPCEMPSGKIRQGKNLVITHHVRDEYVNEKSTGNKEIDGCKIIEGEVDLVLWIEKRITKEKGMPKVTSIISVKDSRWRELEGLVTEDSTYSDLVALLGI